MRRRPTKGEFKLKKKIEQLGYVYNRERKIPNMNRR